MDDAASRRLAKGGQPIFDAGYIALSISVFYFSDYETFLGLVAILWPVALVLLLVLLVVWIRAFDAAQYLETRYGKVLTIASSVQILSTTGLVITTISLQFVEIALKVFCIYCFVYGLTCLTFAMRHWPATRPKNGGKR